MAARQRRTTAAPTAEPTKLQQWLATQERALKQQPKTALQREHEASEKTRLERAYLAVVRLAGLPEPEPQIKFHPTRRFRSDFGYRSRRILIEIEGGIWSNGRHTRGSGYRDDCFKYNEAALLGWLVLRFTADMIKDGTAVDATRRALQTRTKAA